MMNKYHIKYISEGKCIVCCKNNDNLPRQKCEECSNRFNISLKKRRKSNKQKGLCRCGDKKLSVGLRCEKCFLKALASRATGDVSNWLKLKELLIKQNNRCIYTGKKLVLGDNASLDHIIPLSKDGDRALYNVQWVDFQINDMKTNFTHEEFIDTMKLILKRII